ncbi:MAG: histidinol dehydrogenase [Alphaproteobacteria bacterium]|nr:histidinol dehydrogenase [Alphaproteobacteria bacterium]
MALRLNSAGPEFAQAFAAMLGNKREEAQDVNADVAAILNDVRQRGDEAVIEYTEKFDRFQVADLGMKITPAEISKALERCPEDVFAALKLAHGRIRAFHEKQLPDAISYTDEDGVELGHRWTAVEAAGLYVPGGTAAYPSSVLMNAVPAKAAGVERLCMVVPTPDGITNDQVLAAASIAGVDEIYRIGGAQAIGALAYGTKTIAPVAKIVGPGNAYVAAAKRQVFGTVGIDMIAGPSEVLVMADEDNSADWIAADLLAQAEHDVSAQSILITSSEALADQVMAAVDGQLKTLPRADIAAKSWQDNGVVIVVPSLRGAIGLVDQVAPEHLEISAKDEAELAAAVRNAGALFLGAHTPEAVGDYVGGPNHVLPTARSARFSSGLGVLDFMKRTSILRCSAEALRKIGPAAVTLGRAEGLEAHARSVALRLNMA